MRPPVGGETLKASTSTEGSVGLAGATLGGGFGFLTRRLGTACGNLIGAEIVVAEGEDGADAIEADPGDHADQLWALRGTGNGKVPNIGLQDWETAYWADNVDRLRRIKAVHDPHNVFRYEQSIPPAACRPAR
ncbi:BBE domain-containing protein [Streptomyces tropicalis]|uniref:BBE domain-containing protein n=1 Tax=Streptomyces tropicalis TaxID=3034234 RepID=A0ABT5ZYM1_9ACTN|nr:BBE domain-containing protein [Streptomyces tropicalis]MDF3297492.1 BBE domain-containing protein [Streptomyces tropicalis]